MKQKLYPLVSRLHKISPYMMMIPTCAYLRKPRLSFPYSV